MIWYNIKLAFRNAFRNKWISLINIIGLSLGLTTVILLTAYLSIELKRGTNLPEYEKVYSLQPKNNSRLSNPMVELFRNNIPEIKQLTSFNEAWFQKAKFSYNEKEYNLGKILIGDSLFFDVFKYPVVYGNTEGALDTPNSIVITKKVASTLFGDINPIGKQIKLMATGNDDGIFTVSAVIKNFPKDAMFQFDAIYSRSTLKVLPYYDEMMAHWGQCNYIAFFQLKSHELASSIEEKANKYFQEKAPNWIKEDSKGFVVKPYKSLYFDAESSDGFKHSNIMLINILGATGLLILILCLINYINMSLAKDEGNSKSYRIYKYLGAKTANIIQKSFFDMAPSLLIASFLSIILSTLFLKGFSNLVELKITLKDLFSLSNFIILLTTLLLSLFMGGFFSGFYQVRNKNKQKVKANKSSSFLNGLVVTQFVISIVFIVFTLTLLKQLNFMENKSLGVDTENILYLNLQGELEGKQESFKDELLKIPGITNTTFTSSIFGNVNQSWGMTLKNKGAESRVGYMVMSVDKGFFDFYGIKFVEGTSFRENSMDEKHHIFNESAIRSFGIDNINSAFITSFNNASGDIIGVVEDFNFQKLEVSVTNLGFLLGNPEDLNYLCLKTDALSASALNKLIKNIEKTWDTFCPDWPMEYGFQDQTLNEMYEAEVRLSRIVILASIIALFIACIGLLGISIFTIERRIKEIGVRKVNGARNSQVILLLNKDFAKWVIIACIFSVPLAYYFLGKWLDNFAYKTPLSWWIFATAGVTSLTIALLTVSWQSWRAATRNPVESLKYE